jgi:hypothetical protein
MIIPGCVSEVRSSQEEEEEEEKKEKKNGEELVSPFRQLVNREALAVGGLCFLPHRPSSSPKNIQ